MGLSASQAKFLAITSRKVDLEYRMQQICNRRVRLANDLEQVADTYNRAISDRRLFTSVGDTYEYISLDNLHEEAFHVYDTQTGQVLGANYVTDINVISDASELVAALTSGFASGSDYILTNDISLSAADNLALAGTTRDLAGKFEGNGFSIEGLTTMLFDSTTSTGEIEDLFLENSAASLTGDNQALLVGSNAGTISNVGVASDVSVDANSHSNVGVISGVNTGTIENTYSQADITEASGSNIGSISGNNSGTIEQSYAGEQVNISGTGGSIGGVVGKNTGTVSEAYSLGDIQISGTSSRDVGGVVGWNGGSLDNTFAYGSVQGYDAVGGVIGGANTGSITNSYSIATVSGHDELGGLIGHQSATHTADNTNFQVSDITVQPDAIGINAGTDNVQSLSSVEVNWGKSPIPTFNADPDWTAHTNVTPTLADLPVNVSTAQKTEYVAVNQITSADTFAATSTSSTVTNAAADVGSYSGLTANSLTDVQYYDATGTLVPDAIAINDAAGLKWLSDHQSEMDMAGNYIVMADVDLTGFSWDSIGTGTWSGSAGDSTDTSSSFTGTFNGNLHTISNMKMSAGDTAWQGMFGASSGTIQNINIDGLDMDFASVYNGSTYTGYVGGILGINQNGGVVENCNITGLDLDIAGRADEVGGIVGKNFGSVDRCSVTGEIDIGGNSSDCGALIGWHNSGTVTKSFADVDITVAGSGSYTNGFIGDNSDDIVDCYNLGILNVGGAVRDEFTDNGGSVTRCFRGNGSDYRFYSSFDSYTTRSISDVHNQTGAYASNEMPVYEAPQVNGVDVWSFPSGSHPELNFGAVNTVEATYDYVSGMTSNNANGDFIDPVTLFDTSSLGGSDIGHVEYDFAGIEDGLDISLEEGLRSGRYELVADADTYTQDPLSPTNLLGSTNYERRDWRTTSIVHDDLYEANDYEAQTQYESKVDEINNQDKKLELEQQKIDTEYKAITTERDTIKKLIQKNSESSFKIFS